LMDLIGEFFLNLGGWIRPQLLARAHAQQELCPIRRRQGVQMIRRGCWGRHRNHGVSAPGAEASGVVEGGDVCLQQNELPIVARRPQDMPLFVLPAHLA
jgi:hypothetical protein